MSVLCREVTDESAAVWKGWWQQRPHGFRHISICSQSQDVLHRASWQTQDQAHRRQDHPRYRHRNSCCGWTGENSLKFLPTSTDTGQCQFELQFKNSGLSPMGQGLVTSCSPTSSSPRSGSRRGPQFPCCIVALSEAAGIGRDLSVQTPAITNWF